MQIARRGVNTFIFKKRQFCLCLCKAVMLVVAFMWHYMRKKTHSYFHYHKRKSNFAKQGMPVVSFMWQHLQGKCPLEPFILPSLRKNLGRWDKGPACYPISCSSNLNGMPQVCPWMARLVSPFNPYTLCWKTRHCSNDVWLLWCFFIGELPLTSHFSVHVEGIMFSVIGWSLIFTN